MKEEVAERAAAYIETTTRTLANLKTRTHHSQISKDEVDRVIAVATNYTSDAKHYASKSQQVTSLACVAYAEGLLDALKFLGLTEVLGGH